MINTIIVAPKKGASTGISNWAQNLFSESVGVEEVKLLNLDEETYVESVGNNGYFGKEPEMADVSELSNKLEKIVSENNIDIMHYSLMSRPFEVERAIKVAETAKKLNCAVIMHFHCYIEEFYDKNQNDQKLNFNKLISLTDLALVMNQGSKKFLETEYGAKCKCEYLANFVGRDALNETRNYAKISNIISVGNMERNAGIFDTIEVAKKHPHIQFNMIGGIEKATEDLISQKDFLPKNVKFHGRKTPAELKKHWQKADLFLFPTYYKGGFSMALLEAMSQGLPCLASASMPNKEVLKKHLKEQTFTAGVVEELDNKLSHLINLPVEGLKEIGETNLKTVKNNYLSNIIIDRLIDIYSKLLA